MTVSRRLAAILAADVAGYSRLKGADEEGTHHRLRAHSRSWSSRRSASIPAALSKQFFARVVAESTRKRLKRGSRL